MPRYAKNISESEFRERLVKALIKAKDFEEDPAAVNSSNILEYMHCEFPKHMTDKIEKDLSKVQFDVENCDNKGFRVLPNGLLVLACWAGGDWENPIGFVIYFDGKDFRGYIPSDGNHYNRKTKTAFGNDEVSDKEQGYDSDDYDAHCIEWNKVLQDCANRIHIKG